MIKLDDTLIEPLSEAFGQNLETININQTVRGSNSSESSGAFTGSVKEFDKESISAALQLASEPIAGQNGLTSNLNERPKAVQPKTLSIIDKLNGKEVIDDMETIVARDVEQANCAPFKKVEIIDEKKSINEPKFIPVSFHNKPDTESALLCSAQADKLTFKSRPGRTYAASRAASCLHGPSKDKAVQEGG